jgi:hypothetical protein
MPRTTSSTTWATSSASQRTCLPDARRLVVCPLHRHFVLLQLKLSNLNLGTVRIIEIRGGPSELEKSLRCLAPFFLDSLHDYGCGSWQIDAIRLGLSPPAILFAFARTQAFCGLREHESHLPKCERSRCLAQSYNGHMILARQPRFVPFFDFNAHRPVEISAFFKTQ